MGEGIPVRRACEITGVSSSSLYRKPPGKPKDEALKERLTQVWRPNMGYRLAWGLVKDEFSPLNVKRVHRLWKELRLGRVKRYRKKRTGDSLPYLATAANEVWTVDFAFDACLNGTKLKVLSVVDEFTRECLALEVSTRLRSADVRLALRSAVALRGAPKFVRSDNGSEFASRSLAVFLWENKVGSRFIAPGKPWQNGFVESFHSTLRRDFLDVEAFSNLADAQVKAAVYRRYYNEVRPHSSLGYRAPSVAAQDWKTGRATPSLVSNLDDLQSSEVYF